MKETKRVCNCFWNFLKGFVDMIGENFQIYLLPVEGAIGSNFSAIFSRAKNWKWLNNENND